MKESLNDTIEKFSLEVWKDNYKGSKELDVIDTFKRIAKKVASVEKDKELWENKFLNLMKEFKLIPAGRILSNIGLEERKNSTSFNCYTHHPYDTGLKNPDSIEGIYSLLADQAKILAVEGGYGQNFSYLRPNGSYVNGNNIRTPGVLKFLELWDKSSEIVTCGTEKILGEEKQNEKRKIRKGAQMGVLNINSPDIIEFIKVKQTPGRLSKFNLSIGIVDGFMNALKNDLDWDLEFPDTTYDKYKTEWFGDLIDWKSKGFPTVIHETLKAKNIWEEIMKATYNRNEPGIMFLDLINKINPLNGKEKIYQTNPCGEIPMSTGVCNLSSHNLVKYIILYFDGSIRFDFESYKEDVKTAIRFLDNINDISTVPLDIYKTAIKEKRRIGLGFMGYGSALMMLGIKYGSEECLKFTKKLMKIKAETELLYSAELGKEKGNFELFDSSHYFNTEYFNNLKISDEVKNKIKDIGCMRNSHHSMFAPNGNTGIFAGIVSGGIEPVFSTDYFRWSIVNEKELNTLKSNKMKFPDIHNGEWFETKDLKFSKRGTEDILKGKFNNINYECDKNRGLVKQTEVIDYGYKWCKENLTKDQFKKYKDKGAFSTTNELSVEDHIKTLKVLAHYCNQAISKTVNIPKDYPYEKFKDLYLDAYKSGIKGITTYRDGTMSAVLERKETVEKEKSELETLFIKSNGYVIKDSVKLPGEYYSKGYKIKDINKKKWYVNIIFADRNLTKPFGMFINTNCHESTEIAGSVVEAMETLCINKEINEELIVKQKEKYNGQSNVNKIARAIGMALRHNVQIQDIINVLDEHNTGISTLIFHIKKLLSNFIKDGTKVVKDDKEQECPSCGQSTLRYEQGCISCNSCAWSKCG